MSKNPEEKPGGVGIFEDRRALRNGNVKPQDLRRVEGSRLFIDVIARKSIPLEEVAQRVGVPNRYIDVIEYFKRNDLEITTLAGQQILWGDA